MVRSFKELIESGLRSAALPLNWLRVSLLVQARLRREGARRPHHHRHGRPHWVARRSSSWPAAPLTPGPPTRHDDDLHAGPRPQGPRSVNGEPIVESWANQQVTPAPLPGNYRSLSSNAKGQRLHGLRLRAVAPNLAGNGNPHGARQYPGQSSPVFRRVMRARWRVSASTLRTSARLRSNAGLL